VRCRSTQGGLRSLIRLGGREEGRPGLQNGRRSPAILAFQNNRRVGAGIQRERAPRHRIRDPRASKLSLFFFRGGCFARPVGDPRASRGFHEVDPAKAPVQGSFMVAAVERPSPRRRTKKKKKNGSFRGAEARPTGRVKPSLS